MRLLLSFLYTFARLLGDINAAKKGRVRRGIGYRIVAGNHDHAEG
jgi:hypothetical protein